MNRFETFLKKVVSISLVVLIASIMTIGGYVYANHLSLMNIVRSVDLPKYMLEINADDIENIEEVGEKIDEIKEYENLKGIKLSLQGADLEIKKEKRENIEIHYKTKHLRFFEETMENGILKIRESYIKVPFIKIRSSAQLKITVPEGTNIEEFIQKETKE